MHVITTITALTTLAAYAAHSALAAHALTTHVTLSLPTVPLLLTLFPHCLRYALSAYSALAKSVVLLPVTVCSNPWVIIPYYAYSLVCFRGLPAGLLKAPG